jgi:hypothetical protein
MTAIVSAMYKQGKLELLETPIGVREGKVQVIVIGPSESEAASIPLEYGKYREGTPSTEADFTLAEFRDVKGWDADGK